jgi:hypothetical protein
VSGRKVWQAKVLAENPHLRPVEQREQAAWTSEGDPTDDPTDPAGWRYFSDLQTNRRSFTWLSRF